MLSWFLLGICFLAGGLLLARWFVVAEPRDILKAAKIIGAVLLLGLIGFLAFTGRLGLALATLPAVVVWILRFYSVAQIFRRIFVGVRNFSRMGGGAPKGRVSTVDTAFLRMTLDHNSGEMDGQVTQGRFAGRELFTLDDDELTELLFLYRRDDTESAQVLEAYLDRMRPQWRDRAETGQAAEDEGGFRSGSMDEAEALRILGLEPGADAETIKSAHRRLMAALHPDHGGSGYLAAKINQAKDVLLRGR